MKRCVIVGGADINDCGRIKALLKEGDYMIFCDNGLRHMEALGVCADLIVGDFDSHEKPETETEVIVLSREKDDTDTVFAAKEAVKRGFEDFLLIGAVGARLDHTLGNLSILLMLEGLGKRAKIADDYSEMEIVSARPAYIDDSWAFFSILNISGQAEGISIKGARYNLNNASVSCDYQYGISNEVLPGGKAEVRVGKGRLLLVKVRK